MENGNKKIIYTHSAQTESDMLGLVKSRDKISPEIDPNTLSESLSERYKTGIALLNDFDFTAEDFWTTFVDDDKDRQFGTSK